MLCWRLLFIPVKYFLVAPVVPGLWYIRFCNTIVTQITHYDGCYSKTWGNSAILWSLTVTAQMTHHDDILLLFGLCWIANVWNKKPVFVYRQSQCCHQCMLLGVCLPSALTKDEWAPFWIQRHFNFHAYAILGLCWDYASKSATYKNGFMTRLSSKSPAGVWW